MPIHLEAINKYIERARAAGDTRAAIKILRDILSEADAYRMMRELSQA